MHNFADLSISITSQRPAAHTQIYPLFKKEFHSVLCHIRDLRFSGSPSISVVVGRTFRTDIYSGELGMRHFCRLSRNKKVYSDLDYMTSSSRKC